MFDCFSEKFFELKYFNTLSFNNLKSYLFFIYCEQLCEEPDNGLLKYITIKCIS